MRSPQRPLVISLAWVGACVTLDYKKKEAFWFCLSGGRYVLEYDTINVILYFGMKTV